MTSGRRSKEIRRANGTGRLAQPKPDDEHGFVFGYAATDADLPEAHQLVHDKLCSIMGDARSSEVEYHDYQNGEAFAVLDEATKNTTSSEHHALYRRLRGLLREYDGWLVMATATGRKRR